MKKSRKQLLIDNFNIISKIVDKNSIEGDADCIDYINILFEQIDDDIMKNVLGRLLSEIHKTGVIKQEQVLEIIEACEKIPLTKEIVFMPYKSSMWDSMESVYLCAIKDTNVDVKVMPIPYCSFDRKTGGSHFHYEGADFEYLKGYVHYEGYDLAEEKPDVIIIHNPYDDKNLVTRVDERFFSSNLMKFTNHLVYIPYDVVVGDKIDNNYCMMPGVQNAWRVYVQSESIRQEYIKWNCAEKIVALGSPKIDAVVNKTKEIEDIPKCWREIIHNRKVFLFNTHLAGILSEAKNQIERIRRMGELFCSASDMVLLWRPHPLSIQTAEAMNPAFLNSYLALIEYMKAIPNVIYDDTPDMNRAIAISDAYIGDQSSLVMLYGFTGKPMYLHSVVKKECMGYNGVYCLNARIINRDLWLSHMNYNALFRIDLFSMKIKDYIKIPCEGRNEELLFGDIYSVGESLLLVPYSADYFVWYDLISKEFSFAPYESAVKQKMFSSIITDTCIYLFAFCRGNKNVMIDLEKKSLEFFQTNYETLQKHVDLAYDYVWGNRGVYAHGKCWLVLRQNNGIVSISHDGDMNFHFIDAKGNGFRQIAYDGDKFWLIQQRGTEIICWDEQKGVIKRLCLEDSYIYKSCAYEGIICVDDATWILPSCAQYVLRISKNLEEIQQFSIPKEVHVVGEGEALFSGYQLSGSSIYLFPFRSSGVVEINVISMEITYRKVEMKENPWKKEFFSSMQNASLSNINDYIYRDTIFSLNEFFLETMNDTDEKRQKRKRAFSETVENGDGSAGNKIWSSIMMELKREMDG